MSVRLLLKVGKERLTKTVAAGLRTLHLSCGRIQIGNPLQNLHTLVTTFWILKRSCQLLSPLVFPSLRIFALEPSRIGRLSGPLQNVSFRQLLDQLDVFIVYSHLIDMDALKDFGPFFSKTLISVDSDFDRDLHSRLTPRLQHVRFDTFNHFMEFTRDIYYNRINPVKLPLRSLYFDAVHRNVTIQAQEGGVLKEVSVNELFPGVEVVYEIRGGDWPFAYFISEEFIARQSRRK